MRLRSDLKQESKSFFDDPLTNVPRLLGQLNRNPSSKTYGSFDRAFWHYRTNDISSCRYQEAVYTLALLYTSEFKGNQYYQDEQLLKWIRASLSFTAILQRKNGSFDEWYINEGSYVGTAFLTAALCQTLLLLHSRGIDIPEANILRPIIRKAARFLSESEEKIVLNQVSGAVCAIGAAGTLCDDSELLQRADSLLDSFLMKQSDEGWWSEYGGPDIGYLSLTVSYLHKYMRITKSKKPSEAIQKAVSFIEAFIHPDLTAGGEYMARNTEYLIPSAALPYLGAVLPSHLDDRYLCYILYNWIETGIESPPKVFKPAANTRYFAESTLLRELNTDFFLAANGRKGGAFRIYSGKKVYYDCGIEIRNSGRVLSTGVLNDGNVVSYESNELHVRGFASYLQEPLLRTNIMLPFKAGQLVLGRFRGIQKLLKRFLRRGMIYGSKVSTVPFERTITHSRKTIVIIDVIGIPTPERDVLFGVKSAYTAVPSSKYAPLPELLGQRLTPAIEVSEEGARTVIRRTFSF